MASKLLPDFYNKMAAPNIGKSNRYICSCSLEHQNGQSACQQHDAADLGCRTSVAKISFATVDLAFSTWHTFSYFACWVLVLVAVIFRSTTPGKGFCLPIFEINFDAALLHARRAGRFRVWTLIPRLCAAAYIAFETHHYGKDNNYQKLNFCNFNKLFFFNWKEFRQYFLEQVQTCLDDTA